MARLLAGVVVAGGLAGVAGADTPRPPRGPMGEREITLVNHSAHPVNEVYISATSAQTWGEDLLQDNTLEPGAAIRLRLGRTRECSFDVQIIYDDATREDRLNLDVCHDRTLIVDGSRAEPLPGASGTVHVVALTNHASLPIRQVFISPAYAEQWGDDMLKTQIEVDQTVDIPYRGDCAADLRVVFINRAAEERRGLDLCRMSALSIEPGWTTAEPPPTTPPARHSELAAPN